MQERGHLAAGDDTAGTVHISLTGGLQPLVTPAVPTDGGARFCGGPDDGGELGRAVLKATPPASASITASFYVDTVAREMASLSRMSCSVRQRSTPTMPMATQKGRFRRRT